MSGGAKFPVDKQERVDKQQWKKRKIKYHTHTDTYKAIRKTSEELKKK